MYKVIEECEAAKDGHGIPEMGVKGFGWLGRLEMGVDGLGWVWRGSWN